MKKIIIASCMLASKLIFAQVGINTPTPNATLDVVAKTTDGSKPEGIIAPRLTGDQIKLADSQYASNQKGALVYATAAVGTASTKTANITKAGYYYFDGALWQRIINDYVNIYNSNGTLEANRIVTMADKTLSFTSTATTGTSHFQVDGTTLNVDAVNNRVGLGVAAPSTKLHINNGNTPGAIRIVDGTQGAGKVLVSDANGVGTWRDSSGSTTVIQSSVGPSGINIATAAGTFSYTGASATVTTPGYYIISPRMATDKSPAGCGNFIAYNLSKSPNAANAVAFPQQDIHMPSGSGVFDFIYTSNIAYLSAGTYYMRIRRGDGCSYNRTRTNAAQNSFTLTLLK